MAEALPEIMMIQFTDNFFVYPPEITAQALMNILYAGNFLETGLESIRSFIISAFTYEFFSHGVATRNGLKIGTIDSKPGEIIFAGRRNTETPHIIIRITTNCDGSSHFSQDDFKRMADIGIFEHGEMLPQLQLFQISEAVDTQLRPYLQVTGEIKNIDVDRIDRKRVFEKVLVFDPKTTLDDTLYRNPLHFDDDQGVKPSFYENMVTDFMRDRHLYQLHADANNIHGYSAGALSNFGANDGMIWIPRTKSLIANEARDLTYVSNNIKGNRYFTSYGIPTMLKVSNKDFDSTHEHVVPAVIEGESKEMFVTEVVLDEQLPGGYKQETKRVKAANAAKVPLDKLLRDDVSYAEKMMQMIDETEFVQINYKGRIDVLEKYLLGKTLRQSLSMNSYVKYSPEFKKSVLTSFPVAPESFPLTSILLEYRDKAVMINIAYHESVSFNALNLPGQVKQLLQNNRRQELHVFNFKQSRHPVLPGQPQIKSTGQLGLIVKDIPDPTVWGITHQEEIHDIGTMRAFQVGDPAGEFTVLHQLVNSFKNTELEVKSGVQAAGLIDGALSKVISVVHPDAQNDMATLGLARQWTETTNWDHVWFRPVVNEPNVEAAGLVFSAKSNALAQERGIDTINSFFYLAAFNENDDRNIQVEVCARDVHGGHYHW